MINLSRKFHLVSTTLCHAFRVCADVRSRRIVIANITNCIDQDLVDLRRLGQTNLGSGKSNSGNELGLFSYVHLRAPLPPITHSEIFGAQTPESYFLMRRSYDGFVSSTGMLVKNC